MSIQNSLCFHVIVLLFISSIKLAIWKVVICRIFSFRQSFLKDFYYRIILNLVNTTHICLLEPVFKCHSYFIQCREDGFLVVYVILTLLKNIRTRGSHMPFLCSYSTNSRCYNRNLRLIVKLQMMMDVILLAWM